MAPPPSTFHAAASSSSSLQPRLHRSGHRDPSTVGMRKQPTSQHATSFHGRTSPAFAPEHRPIRRPKTQPDLLGSGGARSLAQQGRAPAKLLVNVTVQRSLGPVQVMASTDWTVGDLVAAAIQRYASEQRRPPLPAAQPAAFSLHYSQFSLERLDHEEKLIKLVSRNFFLCFKPGPEITESTSCSSVAATATSSCSKQAEKTSTTGTIPRSSFMDCLLWLV